MSPDKREFFEEASRRIIGSLEFEKALWDCFMYIRQYIPADHIYFQVYDPETGIAELIAKADINGGELISIKTAVSSEIRHRMVEHINSLQGPMLHVADRRCDHWLLGPVLENVADPDDAFMLIGPKPEWNMLSAIEIGNHAGEKYSKEHVRLYTLLNEPFAIAISNYLRYREVLRLKDILMDDKQYLEGELLRQTGAEIVGANFGLKQVMDMVHQVSPLSSPVLLRGETGTGKEVIAMAIHNFSTRRKGSFIKVNCGAIPESLMDSELFGHEKGSFTGALSQKRGRFERAHGGTIFLDEIGELTPGAQVRLLRVLQDKEIERVGGTESIPVDIRVIAATHRNLEVMLHEGKFREDLYFRLRVFPIVIPPLRERRPDIPVLVQHFIMKKVREMGLAEVPSLGSDAIDKLMNYDWPGNVRELQNTVERSLILCKGRPLVFDDLGGIADNTIVTTPMMSAEDSRGLDECVSNLVSQRIMAALQTTNGRVGGEKGAAKLLKMHPATLRSKMRKMGIPFGRKK
jgi:transcriptional regulator with GAF, ATPase, and Fis domain